MEAAFRETGEKFAQKIIGREFDEAREILAPWLRNSISAEQLESIIREGCRELPPPALFDVDGNSCTLDDLEVDEHSPPTKPLPPEITNQNFRKWMVIQFLPDPEEETGYDACFDLWMALVEVDGALKIGYLEATGAD
ncbi:MAG TPA: hypothetical protein VJW51_13610 [Candidatus Acidoferrales bacterium]|nr:hypothetical protein [Candidatus Acidoferrales bacterium]